MDGVGVPHFTNHPCISSFLVFNCFFHWFQDSWIHECLFYLYKQDEDEDEDEDDDDDDDHIFEGGFGRIDRTSQKALGYHMMGAVHNIIGRKE